MLSRKVVLGIMAGVVATLGGGIVALSQVAGPPMQGQPGGPGFRGQMSFQVIRGKVIAKDEQRQAIQIEQPVPPAQPEAAPPLAGAPGAPAGMWIGIRPRTYVKRVVEATVGDLKMGDEIWVEGRPQVIDARRIVAGQLPEIPPGAPVPMGPPAGVAGGGYRGYPPQGATYGIPGYGTPGPVENAPVPGGAVGPPMAKAPGPGMPEWMQRGRPVVASARGTVVSLEPLVIECEVPSPPLPPAPPFAPTGAAAASPPAPDPRTAEPEVFRVTVTTDEDTRVLKLVDSSFEDIQMGEEVAVQGPAGRRGMMAFLVVVGVQPGMMPPVIEGPGPRG